MSNYVGSHTPLGTGVVNLSIPFTPVGYQVRVGAENGASGNITDSFGHADSTVNQACKTMYFDGSNRTCNRFQDRVVHVYKYTSTWIDMMRVNHSGYSSGVLSLNVTTLAASGNYQLMLDVV